MNKLIATQRWGTEEANLQAAMTQPIEDAGPVIVYAPAPRDIDDLCDTDRKVLEYNPRPGYFIRPLYNADLEGISPERAYTLWTRANAVIVRYVADNLRVRRFLRVEDDFFEFPFKDVFCPESCREHAYA